MMPRLCRFVPCCLLAVVAGAFAPGLREACAQNVGEDQPAAPERAALNRTAATLPGERSPISEAWTTVWIRDRFDAFQDEFSSDFGVVPPLALEEDELVEHIESRIAARWGDTRWFDWLQSGIAMYARFQGWMETERRGFDMEVETDDLTEGKVGVRVSRSLE